MADGCEVVAVKRNKCDEETALLHASSQDVDREDDGKALHSFDEVLERVGVGAFHVILILVAGWALASDSVEIQCISFVTPQLDAGSNSNDNTSQVPRLPPPRHVDVGNSLCLEDWGEGLFFFGVRERERERTREIHSNYDFELLFQY